MELRIPPVIVFLLCLGFMFGCYFILPDYNFFFPYRRTLSRLFLVAGVLSGILGVLAFRLGGTTVDPTQPQKASRLITSGIYRYTRNPMYLGMALVLIGGWIRIANPVAILGVVAFVIYMTRFQIKPEEKALLRIFGEEYTSYASRVRRWV